MEPKLSFVIPCYGSEHTIKKVIDEIEQTVKKKNDYEIICVNDCSPDGVLSVLKEIAEDNRHIKVISLSKNFGQHNALMAGYRHVTGDLIISMDDDGQTPASECYKLIEALDVKNDVIFARYKEKHHSLPRRLSSNIAGMMGRMMLGYPKGFYGSSYYVCRRYVIDEIIRYENPYTFIAGLLFRTTRKIGNADVNHRERISGRSGYSFHKLMALWLNGFTAFSIKPLRIATIGGTTCAIIGFLFGIFTVIRKIIDSNIAIGYSSLMAVLLFIGGLLMLMVGLVGEYIGRVYISINNSPQYVIRESININKSNEGNDDYKHN